MQQEGMNIVRTDIIGRVERLMDACGELQVGALCDQVDEIRVIARRHGLDAVERLASLLESVVAYNGHRQIAFNYLGLMRDAAHCDLSGPEIASAYLAAAALRGCR